MSDMMTDDAYDALEQLGQQDLLFHKRVEQAFDYLVAYQDKLAEWDDPGRYASGVMHGLEVAILELAPILRKEI